MPRSLKKILPRVESRNLIKADVKCSSSSELEEKDDLLID